MPWN